MTAITWRLKRGMRRGKMIAVRTFDDLLALLVATAILSVLLTL